MAGTSIELNPFEIEVIDLLITSIAKQQNKTYYRRNPVDSAKNIFTAQKEGICAELAFCKIKNLYPDLSIHEKVQLVDCVWRGYKVDVKNTTTGRLLIQKDDSGVFGNPIEIYVLMIGKIPRYQYFGWAWKWELIRRENIRNLGDYHHKPFCLDIPALHTEDPTPKQSIMRELDKA